VISLKKINSVLQYIIIIYFALYLILGNFPRFIKATWLPSNISVSEILLLLLTGVYAVINLKLYIKLLKMKRIYFIFIGIILIFSVMGVIYHKGQAIQSFLYCIRLVGQLIATFIIGHIFNIKFKKNFKKVIDLILGIFFIYTLIGWTILIIFPESIDFWLYLKKFGIIFYGDPHIGRFYGSFFDPNFASSIIVFPLLLCLYLYFKDNRRISLYLFLSLYFINCIIYSYSRSGILGICIGLFVIGLIHFINIIKGKENFNKNIIIFSVGFILLIVIILVTNSEVIPRLTGRFVGISNDPSAQHRFDSIQIGADHLLSNDSKEVSTLFTSPIYKILMGIGYNYIRVDLRTGLSALDSSILNTFICFGVLGTILLLITFGKYLKSIFRNTLKYNKKIGRYILAYILAALAICNFNDLLYYQFFIITFMSFLNYVYLLDIVDE